MCSAPTVTDSRNVEAVVCDHSLTKLRRLSTKNRLTPGSGYRRGEFAVGPRRRDPDVLSAGPICSRSV